MADGRTGTSLSQKLATSVTILGTRLVVATGMNAVQTAILARLLGVSDFGYLAAGLAAFWLATAAVDFGFSPLLGRELATDPDGRGRLLRAVFQVQIAWAAIPALVLVVLALVGGESHTAGLVILVLVPAIVTGGVVGGRQVYLALYRTKPLARIDIATNAAQLVSTVTVAALGGGAVAVAASISICWIANDLIVALGALRLVDAARPERADRNGVVIRAVPLGLVSFMATLYFTLDLVLVTWLVDGQELGAYAAACKILSLLIVVPGLLAGVALPALSESARDPAALRALVGRIVHWLTAVGVPVCVAVAIFARPIVRVAFGPDYDSAVPLVRILCAAGTLTLVANVLGTLLIARSMIRPMLLQNGVAIAFNVAGNLVLVPYYGVTASAWLTVATELIVCAGALWALRGHVSAAEIASEGLRPLLAVAGLAVTGPVFVSQPLVGIPAAAAVFGVLVLMLGAWPAELTPARRRTN